MFDFTILGVGHLALGAVLTLDVLLTKQRPVSAVLWLAVQVRPQPLPAAAGLIRAVDLYSNLSWVRLLS